MTTQLLPTGAMLLLREALKDKQQTGHSASKPLELSHKWQQFLRKASVRVAEMLRHLFATPRLTPDQKKKFRDEADRLLRAIARHQKSNAELKAYANAFVPIDNQLQKILTFLDTQNNQVPVKRPRH